MLDILLTSRVRLKVVGLFALNPGESFYMRQVAAEVSEGVHAVRLELVRLARAGLLIESRQANRIYYRINRHYRYFGELVKIVGDMKEEGCREFRFDDFARRRRLQATLEEVTGQIIGRYTPQKIILFGSSAGGKVTEGSDIDLLIVKDTPKRYYDRLREIAKLCDYSVGVDFVVYTPKEFEEKKREPFFRSEILKKGKIIYDKGRAA